MALFAHHAEAFLALEINGRPFPDGMTEHALAVGLGVVVSGLTAYGLVAAVRDALRRWRRSARPAAA
jgi:hypothetical protein